MTKSQKLELRASEIRQRLNAISSLEGESLTGEIRSEADRLGTEYRDVETRRRAAIVAEDAAEERAAREAGREPDAEARERDRLGSRVSLERYIVAGRESRAVDGPEGEYNEALGMGRDAFPLRVLAPAREERATTDADAGAMQQTWLDRLFADTAAMRLGIGFPSVRPGVAAYPVTTAGASGAQRGRSEAVAEASWTVGVTELKPTRNSVRAVFTVEDAARLSGLEEALRRDLRMALTEAVDRAIFLGDGGANEDPGDITGLTTAAITEVALTQANKLKPSNTVARFAGMIDGRHAASPADLRIVATVGANTLWMSTIANSVAENQTIAQFLRASGLDWGVRGEIETDTVAGDFGAFVGRARGIAGAGVAPVWDQATLIRDPYSEAAKGEVALTLSYLWSFGLPRASNFQRLKFVA